MGVVIGFVVGVFVLVGAGLLIYVRRLRKKKSSPHVLKGPLSDSPSVAYDLKSLRMATSFSGVSGVSGMSGVPAGGPYGAVPVPDEEGSLYHEPYKNFSASEYSVATIGRHLTDFSKEGVVNGVVSGGGGGGEYAVPILSTPPPPFNTAATTPISAPAPFTHPSTPISAAPSMYR